MPQELRALGDLVEELGLVSYGGLQLPVTSVPGTWLPPLAYMGTRHLSDTHVGTHTQT